MFLAFLLVTGLLQEPRAEDFPPWMAQVRQWAPCYGYRIPKDDWSWEEWFWLYDYLENHSARRAARDRARYYHVKQRRLKGCNG